MSSEAVRLGRDFWIFRILAELRGQKIGWEFDRFSTDMCQCQQITRYLAIG
jgi:hypothetical protein